MDWTAIVLFFILLVLYGIGKSLERIAKELANKPVSDSSQFPDLSGIEDQLENIFYVMGGEAKMKEATLKKRKEHFSTLVKALVLSGKTQKQAEEEASKHLEENEFDETLGEDYAEFSHYVNPENAISAIKWAKKQFIEDRNNKKYGHLMVKARGYLSGVTQIGKYDHKMQDFLKTDWQGEKWIIQKLIQERRLKAITEYSEDLSTEDVKHYEVLEPAK